MINILCHTISNRHHSNFHITWTIFHPFDFMCEMLFCWVERSWIRILSFKTVCVLFYCLLLLPLVVYNIVKTSGTSLFSPLYIHTGFSADNFHSKLCQVSNFSVCQGVFLNILRRNRGEDREMEKKRGEKTPIFLRGRPGCCSCWYMTPEEGALPTPVHAALSVFLRGELQFGC